MTDDLYPFLNYSNGLCQKEMKKKAKSTAKLNQLSGKFWQRNKGKSTDPTQLHLFGEDLTSWIWDKLGVSFSLRWSLFIEWMSLFYSAFQSQIEFSTFINQLLYFHAWMIKKLCQEQPISCNLGTANQMGYITSFRGLHLKTSRAYSLNRKNIRWTNGLVQ